jgi:hypothetical protein
MPSPFQSLLIETLQSSKRKVEKQAQTPQRVYAFVDEYPDPPPSAGKPSGRSAIAESSIELPRPAIQDHWMSTEAYVALYHLEVDAAPPLCLLPDQPLRTIPVCLSPREVFARLA